MVFGKVVKTKHYFSRKQVAFKRRRECKTNYHKRHKIIRQNPQKNNFQQTRLVVNISNRYITAQLVKAYPNGDKTLAAVNSRELRAYKYTFGLKNYSACYLTGLLLGKRAMRESKLHKIYPGNQENVGITHLVQLLPNQPASLRCILDIGLLRPTSGAKVFAVLKGITDAGVNCPFSPRRFYGYDEKKKQLNSSKLLERIRGVTVAKYAMQQQGKSQHFSKYFENGLKPTMCPLIFDQTVKAIHKNPKKMPMVRLPSKKPVTKVVKMKKKSYEERKKDVETLKTEWQQTIASNAIPAA